jgi:hypothetical protein
MRDADILVLAAMICITMLEAGALVAGIDGQLFSTVIAIIAGLAGYVVKAQAVPSRIRAVVRKR